MNVINESEDDMQIEIAKRIFALTNLYAGYDPLNCKRMQGIALQLKEVIKSRQTPEAIGSLK